MKKLIILLFTLGFSWSSYAQTRQDSIQEVYNKISSLENRISNQDSRIAQLLQQVNEVTKQNLALKQNLNLSPTIATAKAGDIMEYRIIEVTGDPENNIVHMVMIADDISGTDKDIHYSYFQTVDDKGHGYENTLMNQRCVLKVEGVTDQLISKMLQHHPNVPYTIDVYLNDCTPDIQCIKYFSMDISDGPKRHKAIFENLPIKWNNK